MRNIKGWTRDGEVKFVSNTELDDLDKRLDDSYFCDEFAVVDVMFHERPMCNTTRESRYLNGITLSNGSVIAFFTDKPITQLEFKLINHRPYKVG